MIDIFGNFRPVRMQAAENMGWRNGDYVCFSNWLSQEKFEKKKEKFDKKFKTSAKKHFIK